MNTQDQMRKVLEEYTEAHKYVPGHGCSVSVIMIRYITDTPNEDTPNDQTK